jgi:hypothetical protein
MTVIRRTILCVAALLALGCDDVAGPGDFEPSVDQDMGSGSGEDTDEETIEGDPCEPESPWECDPVSGEGCEGEGMACGFWTGADPGFYCLSSSTEPAGAACDTKDGPWCGLGATCLAEGDGTAGICVLFCCSDGDCSAAGVPCVEQDWSPVQATLGLCVIETGEADAGPDSGI